MERGDVRRRARRGPRDPLVHGGSRRRRLAARLGGAVVHPTGVRRPADPGSARRPSTAGGRDGAVARSPRGGQVTRWAAHAAGGSGGQRRRPCSLPSGGLRTADRKSVVEGKGGG